MRIRIKWQNKENKEHKGHGSWFNLNQMRLLAAWIALGNKDYPYIKHDLEFEHK